MGSERAECTIVLGLSSLFLFFLLSSLITLSPLVDVKQPNCHQVYRCVAAMHRSMSEIMNSDVLREFGGSEEHKLGPDLVAWNRLLDTGNKEMDSGERWMIRDALVRDTHPRYSRTGSVCVRGIFLI